MKEIIPVFFTIDDLYAPYLGVAMLSLIENASPEYDYQIYVIYQKLSPENRKRIKELEREGFQIHFVPMKDRMEDIKDRTENRLRCDYFTLTIYFRLFLPEMFPQYDKGIYLDSDIVVPGDISGLYRHRLEDNLIAACPDHSVADIPELAKYMEEGLGISRYEYINSGVLLMNLKKMRETAFSGQFLRLLNAYHFDCIAPDQDYLNAMCYGKILYLEECWDAMPNDRKEPLECPQLIHYNLFDKPWCYDNIQYEEYFWEYAKRSVYYDDIRKFKENYPEEQKQSDRESMERLIRKADMVPDTEITFRKIYESGVKVRI